jgi:hypothetical protein
MRVQRKAEVQRESLPVLDSAALAAAKGGLKAERVEGTGPSGPGGG